MSNGSGGFSLPLGLRRGGAALLSVLVLSGVGAAAAAPAGADLPPTGTAQPLVVLTQDHIARSRPSADADRIEAVDARRPLTRARTVLPILDSATSQSGGEWLRVLLPGRPNGHSGWIVAKHTRHSLTPWKLVLNRSARRLNVYRDGHVLRSFPAVVGKPSTPTPRGRFFIEEALALSSSDAGGPFALATSARSRTLHEFAGGPGQIAIHGTDNLAGAPGSAVSHGCIRLATHAIKWLARRVGGGARLTVVG